MQFGPKRFLNIRERPYELLGLFALIFLLLSLIPSKVSLDINMHDSYFVIESNYFYGISTIYFLFIWMLYVVSTKIIWLRWMIWLHVVCTITVTLIFLLMIYFPGTLYGVSGRYYAFSDFQQKDVLIWIKFIPYVVFIFLVGQMIFLLNLMGGLVKCLVKS